MSHTKAKWRRVRFGEMVVSAGATRKVRGWTASETGIDRYVGLEHLDSNSLKIRRWGSPDDVGANSDLRHFEPGDVILARRGIELRKVGAAEFHGVASGHALVFRANPEVILPEFLPFFIQSDAFMKRADRFSVGSLSRTVNLSALTREEFVLPPLAEQRTLAGGLSAAWECVNTHDDAQAAGRRARKALAFFLYEGRACAGPRRITPIGQLPASWEVAPLGERYEVQLGKMISEAARGGPEQTPYLRNANIQWNRLELHDVATMSFSPRERTKFALRHGDILACEGRHVGKSAVWRNEIPGACYQKALHRIRRLSKRDLPDYMLHCLQYYSWAGRFAAETGETTIPHLPAERLRAMLFPFPPRHTQERIAAAIAELDAALAAIEDRRESSRELLKQMSSVLEND